MAVMLLKTQVVSTSSRADFSRVTEDGSLPSEATLCHCDPALHHAGPSSSDGWLPAGATSAAPPTRVSDTFRASGRLAPVPSRFPFPAGRRGHGESA
jgi:hypothetical protein